LFVSPKKTYTYDASGRLTTLAISGESPSRTLDYDIFNNMTAYTATGASQTRAFAYDLIDLDIRRGRELVEGYVSRWVEVWLSESYPNGEVHLAEIRRNIIL
jgi:hypothetical protein